MPDSEASVVLYEVGGCVRDGLLGITSKDIDFAVEADSYATMRQWMVDHNFQIFVESPEFFTIRAHFPKGWDHGMPQYLDYSRLTADFVLCRKERGYSDGRRPDEVEVGTIYDDLARRDFTVNAMARTPEGALLDPHGGEKDLQVGTLRAVGRAKDRLGEDPLRALRAIRFMVTKKMWPDAELHCALATGEMGKAVVQVSVDRIREELRKAFQADSWRTMRLLTEDYRHIGREVFLQTSLWLDPSLKET